MNKREELNPKKQLPAMLRRRPHVRFANREGKLNTVGSKLRLSSAEFSTRPRFDGYAVSGTAKGVHRRHCNGQQIDATEGPKVLD